MKRIEEKLFLSRKIIQLNLAAAAKEFSNFSLLYFQLLVHSSEFKRKYSERCFMKENLCSKLFLFLCMSLVWDWRRKCIIKLKLWLRELIFPQIFPFLVLQIALQCAVIAIIVWTWKSTMFLTVCNFILSFSQALSYFLENSRNSDDLITFSTHANVWTLLQ